MLYKKKKPRKQISKLQASLSCIGKGVEKINSNYVVKMFKMNAHGCCYMNSIDGQDFALNECGALSRVGKNVSGY